MKPTAILDIESTGTDVIQDRIVELAINKYSEGLEGPHEARHYLFNPGIPIQPAATQVHGITDEFIADKPTFGEHATSIYAFLMGCDIAGFNIIDFDVPMLGEEFGRFGIEWPAPGTRFLDGFRVFRAKERRDLAGALKFYCGLDHTNAHAAVGDIEATRQVIVAQMARYEDLVDMNKYVEFCMNPRALDLAGKIELNDDGIAVYAFGKDKGKSVREYPGFGFWMLQQSFPANTKKVVRSLITNQQ